MHFALDGEIDFAVGVERRVRVAVELEQGAGREGLEDDGLLFFERQRLRLRIEWLEEPVVGQRQQGDEQGCVERRDGLAYAGAHVGAVVFEGRREAEVVRVGWEGACGGGGEGGG